MSDKEDSSADDAEPEKSFAVELEATNAALEKCSISLRFQKTLLSRFGGQREVARKLLDGPTSDAVDYLYHMTLLYTNDRDGSQRMIRDLLKTFVKYGVLRHNNAIARDNDIALRAALKSTLRTYSTCAADTHMQNIDFLAEKFAHVSRLMIKACGAKISNNSIQRIERVFVFYGGSKFLIETMSLCQYSDDVQALSECCEKMCCSL